MSLSEFHWHERGKDDSVLELFYCQLNGENLKLEVTD